MSFILSFHDVFSNFFSRNLNVQSAHSKWAELPPVSSMFPFESVDVPGVLFGNQQAMFYEPLCVYGAPDPGRDLHELLAGRVPPGDR